MATDTKSKNPALDFSQQEIDAQIKEREEIERLNSQFRSPSATPEQPIIPSEDANGENYSGRGDTELGDTEPSGDNVEGNQPSTQPSSKKQSKLGQKARQRIDDWKKKTADKAKQKAKDAAKKAGKKALKKLGKKAAVEGAKKAAEAASSETVVAPILIELADKALQLAKIGVKALATGRYEEGISEATKSVSKPIKIALLILGGCFLLFFLIIVMIFGAGISTIGGLQEQDRLMKLAASNATGSASLTITKKGPTSAKKGNSLPYTIQVNDSAGATDITVIDKLPDNTTYLSANGVPHYDPTNKTVTWSTKESFPSSPSSATFTITLQATADNSYVINKAMASASVEPGTGSVPSADRTALLTQIKALIQKGTISFTHSNDTEGLTNLSGRVYRKLDGTTVTIDTQVLRAYVYIAQQGYTIVVESMVGTHPKCVEGSNPCRVSRHWDGHAFDVSSINGVSVSQQSATSKANTIKFMKMFNALIGKDLVPNQLLCAGNGRNDPDVDHLSMTNYKIAPYPPSFTATYVHDHTDHVHVGY